SKSYTGTSQFGNSELDFINSVPLIPRPRLFLKDPKGGGSISWCRPPRYQDFRITPKGKYLTSTAQVCPAKPRKGAYATEALESYYVLKEPSINSCLILKKRAIREDNSRCCHKNGRRRVKIIENKSMDVLQEKDKAEMGMHKTDLRDGIKHVEDNSSKVKRMKNALDQIRTLDIVLSQVVQEPAEGETLCCACNSWLKKVLYEEGKPKKLTRIKRAEMEELSKIGDREEIRVKSNKNEVIWKFADIGT
ncbi:17482_t:CDS:2, partial [Gigaspora rosea]